jgi:hypothetical protein
MAAAPLNTAAPRRAAPRRAMQQPQRKNARAGEPSLPALPDGPLHRIFADVIEREDSLRVMRLLHAALEETSADASQPRVDICGLSASASLFRALQTAPASAGAAAPTLGQLLQRAAGGWMLQSGRMAAPPGPDWDRPTRPPDLAPDSHGRGAPMDGRGACTGVAELHKQLLRGCVDFGAVNKDWYRAWGDSGTGKMCKALMVTLAAVGRRVRQGDRPPREMPEELRQRAYNTQYGPADAVREANDTMQTAREESMQQLVAEFHAFAKIDQPRRSQARKIIMERISALQIHLNEHKRYQSLTDSKRVPLRLRAYDAKPANAKRRSDSYVGLFALVQLAAAADFDRVLCDRARASLLPVLRGVAQTEQTAPIRTVAELKRVANTDARGVHVTAGSAGRLSMECGLGFKPGIVYRASVEPDHGRADYETHKTKKHADVTVRVDGGLTVEQIAQQLEAGADCPHWQLHQFALPNTQHNVQDVPPRASLCPTVQYRPHEPGSAAPSASEWLVGAEYHYGAVACYVQKETMEQNEQWDEPWDEPWDAQGQTSEQRPPLTLSDDANPNLMSLMHYLPPSFAPALSLEDLLGGLQQ